MTVTAHSDAPLPAIPAAIRDAEASTEIMHNLRHFHLGNPEAKRKLLPISGDCLPALLDPYRDSSRLRFDYPLFLHGADEVVRDMDPEHLAQPLSLYLRQQVEGFAPGAESARILKDNLAWLERDLRQRLTGNEGPQPVAPLLTASCEALVAHLALRGDNADKLLADLEKLQSAVPSSGSLLSYGRYPAIHLLIHTVCSVAGPRHLRFRAEIEEKIRKLRKLLHVDREKSAEAKSPGKLAGSIGGAGGLLNAEALSGMMSHSYGSTSMSDERRTRIEQALLTLQTFNAEEVLVRVVHAGFLKDDDWLSRVSGFESVVNEDPSACATEIFDREAARLAQVFAAARIAQLEIDDIYDPAIHDPWFAAFTWEAFSKDELLLVPSVIALEAADRIGGRGMTSFSQLLSSGRPVQVLARVQAHNNPGRREGDDPFHNYRTELGYLAIAHRQAFVAQTSAARHEHLIQGYLEGLSATRTSVHLINTGLKTTGQEIVLNAWLVAGAALEGRVHPFFRMNPDLGDSFAERMDFSGNPAPDHDWPANIFRYRDEDGQLQQQELAFTFADYALLLPELHEHFVTVPPECESDDLVSVYDFLKQRLDAAGQYVPFIWGVDKYGTLHRLVVSRTLVYACRDRLNFWRSLQEMSGVKNRHVQLAVEAVRAEIQTAADAEIAAAKATHEQELTAARAEAAGEVMGRLTDVLMGMDFSSMSPRAAAPAPVKAAAPKAEAPVEQPAPVAEEEEEAVGFDDPWIDTPLCTSCNDCLAINPLMFVYNDINQAVIGDLNAGTYAQMVEAAEICPSKCIHPGKPWNANEAKLDELQARAAAFN